MVIDLKNILRGTVFVLMAAALIGWWFTGSAVSHGPGIIAPDEPVQTSISNASMFMHNDYFITPLATFEVKARVLSRKNYSWGRESDLSPIDFTLGWGRMSDESVLEHIQIRQATRFYFWKVRQFPIPRLEIETHSANMHMIPANRQIERAMKKARQGDLVTFKGKLVRAEAPDGWKWVSSLNRNDTGNGACELVFVEDFEIITSEL
jgi:hypothetical protein